MTTAKAYILLGSNYPDKVHLLKKAAEEISSEVGECIAKSPIYETEAWGFESEESFLNQVIIVTTNLSAKALLEKLLHIEKSMGRIRTTDKYTSRIIDLDILLYNQEIINSPELEVPHPRMHLRKFVLTPMTALSPKLNHPKLHKSMDQLLSDCEDTSWVRKFSS